MSQARLSMMTANINRSEKQPAFEDISVFLPYPSQWIVDNNQVLFKIDRKAAKEFLDTYESFDAEVEMAFTPWLMTIKISTMD